ncbi:MAG: hypothetical protein KDB08_06355 [Microthrixaceae bacterium]|nr:hypothetical protein [Microthrixaceae bacterium]
MGNDTPDLAADLADASAASSAVTWLSLAEIGVILGESPSRVRRLLEDHFLIGSARTGSFLVPALFLQNDELIASLRGTIMVLQDAGFSNDEVIDWLLAVDDTIGVAPIEALRAGRKSEVRRVARTLA